ncbi:MAG: glycosyltransferase [Clostridia bacterium]|nr:glycosyltransferase [Clostridia bacterium]
MLSVIIPMYNEKTVISSTLRTLTEHMEKTTDGPCSYEILLCDDGSDDGCGDIAQNTAAELTLKNGCVRLIRAEKNAGKGAAVRMGMLAAEGDFRLFTDSDLAYGCEVITAMAQHAEETDAKILIGSRAIHPEGYAGYTPIRRLASKVFVRLLAATAGFSLSDSQCGIKLFAKEAAQEIFSRCEVNGWAFDFEVLLLGEKLGYRISEFPVTVINHRESKVRLLKDSWKMMRDVGRIRKRVKNLSL